VNQHIQEKVLASDIGLLVCGAALLGMGLESVLDVRELSLGLIFKESRVK
jgi:hypothetical protein